EKGRRGSSERESQHWVATVEGGTPGSGRSYCHQMTVARQGIGNWPTEAPKPTLPHSPTLVQHAMSADSINRRDFLLTTAGGSLAASVPLGRVVDPRPPVTPAVRRSAVRPLVIADASGIQFKNGGSECAVERAFRLVTEGKDVLDALIAGVNIPELDPEEH